MKKEIAVIGGGASGLVCALVLAQRGAKVTLFEKSAKVGRKILASGNGRCNITNERISQEYYHGHHPHFVSFALKRFGRKEIEKFFQKMGLEFVSIKDGRIFPMSLQASSVVRFLEYGCLKEGVEIRTDTEVRVISKESRFVLRFEKKKSAFDAVVVATGSLAMPSLGSSESGYSFAKAFGHRIFPPFASLVQLVSDDSLVSVASGVKVEAKLEAHVYKEVLQEVRGDLLFTSYGLSGLAILDISRVVSYALQQSKKVEVVIDLLPDFSLASLKKILQNKSHQFKDREITLWLNGMLHQKVVMLLLRKLKMENKAKLGVKELHTLAYIIKNLRINIIDTKGVKSAEVMAGGVDCSEVDSKTMESKRIKGLYFTGEVLDIDGDRGGYNLHWAWASGLLAAKSIDL